ncbi:MAG: hypothetical protein R3D68_00370 [Hyphomicrobiaceae bacterium]
MRKFLSMALAAVVLMFGMAMTSGQADAQHRRGLKKRPGPVVVAPQRVVPGPHVRRRNNTGRNVAIGVGAAILGGIILNEAAKANGYRDDGLSCRQLYRRCDDGQDWACRKFDRRGC